MAEFDIYDYVRMESDNQMNGAHDYPTAPVVIYGDDGDKVVLRFCYNPEDQPIIDKCLASGERVFFVKAYSNDSGQDGINIQTGTIDFSNLGYGPNSTVALRRIIALSHMGGTLAGLEENGLTVIPDNGNHLDMRQDNLIIQDEPHKTATGLISEEYSLGRARYKYFYGRNYGK